MVNPSGEPEHLGIPFRRCVMHTTPVIARLARALVVAPLAIGMLSLTPAHATVADSLVYVDGQTYSMVTAHSTTSSSPGLVKAPPLWVLVYSPSAVPPGYAPQCDPCDHPNNPNLPGGGDYHDHVLPAAPGFGSTDTAGSYEGPWMITILVYNPQYTGGNTEFQPITSDDQLAAAEAASLTALQSGGVPELLPINPGAGDPFEVPTGTVLICPIVRSH
jgi:hypothetical protein